MVPPFFHLTEVCTFFLKYPKRNKTKQNMSITNDRDKIWTNLNTFFFGFCPRIIPYLLISYQFLDAYISGQLNC